MTTHHRAARRLSEAIAERLAHPATVPACLTAKPWWRQSLAHGAPGIALLHVERAAAGLGPWQRAHDWLAYAGSGPLTTGPDSHLYYGAPALAHVLACAAEHRSGSYTRALHELDDQIEADTRCRVDAANRRIDAGRPPALAEFDLIRGLTGLGSYLLRRDPAGEALHTVLCYLVRLTEPMEIDGETLQGWWTTSSPNGRGNDRFAGGHANSGIAHGIAGPLTLLALAARCGVTVNGHFEAIGRICTWLDRWRIDTGTGPIWPYWINRSQLREGRRDISRPQRPGWCYGTAGLARAQQLAALATGDSHRRRMAEDALIQALEDPAQRAATADASLCHGYAGLAHIAARTAADAGPPAADRLRSLIPSLLDTVQPPGEDPEHTAVALLSDTAQGPAFLEGTAGIALAVSAPSATASPRTGWDTCLLIA